MQVVWVSISSGALIDAPDEMNRFDLPVIRVHRIYTTSKNKTFPPLHFIRSERKTWKELCE